MGRFILHSDLNNFYASVESLYNPQIRNKAVAVVGDEEKRHGIVLAKNYIAKSFGVKTGDTVWEAREKCGNTELVCVKARLDLYLKISKMVKDIYREYSSRVESFGVDEAWIDISDIASNFDEARAIADNIRVRIIAEVGLTVSVGVSWNKVFAKLGSDMQKPNATVVITPDNFREKVWPLPVGDLLYVGRATQKKFERSNINTIGDLANADPKYMKLTLGKVGVDLWNFANGKDASEVSRSDASQKIKSFGNSTTCPVDLVSNEQVKSIIYLLAESVAERMRHAGYYAMGVSLWVRDCDLNSFERQSHLSYPTNVSKDIAETCYKLFVDNYNWRKDVRSVGVRVINLTTGVVQCDVFSRVNNLERQQRLESTIETLRSRFGYDIIKRGNILMYDGLSGINPHSETHVIHPIGFFKAK